MGSIGGLRADVLVIGGGPAGLAAAIAARLKGFDVAVVDAARPAIDKACGEGILPAGVSALHRLGVPLTDKTGFPIRGLRFIDGGAAMEALFPEARGLALRRTRLHEALVRRAADLGVRLLWGTPLRGPDDLPTFVGLWAPMAHTPMFDGKPAWTGQPLPAPDSGFGATIGSRPGPTWWRSTGVTVARSMSRRWALTRSAWPCSRVIRTFAWKPPCLSSRTFIDDCKTPGLPVRNAAQLPCRGDCLGYAIHTSHWLATPQARSMPSLATV